MPEDLFRFLRRFPVVVPQQPSRDIPRSRLRVILADRLLNLRTGRSRWCSCRVLGAWRWMLRILGGVLRVRLSLRRLSLQ
jgi:hypothetical protein